MRIYFDFFIWGKDGFINHLFVLRIIYKKIYFNLGQIYYKLERMCIRARDPAVEKVD